jgi:hypothetical protein
VVAHFPGTTRPWSNVSKGGITTCRFDEKNTDWKTRITGTCDKCKTAQCSARFGVMFDCSAHLPPPTTQATRRQSLTQGLPSRENVHAPRPSLTSGES